MVASVDAARAEVAGGAAWLRESKQIPVPMMEVRAMEAERNEWRLIISSLIR
jgi:hypothetical protein